MKFQYLTHKNQPLVTSWSKLIPSTIYNPVPVIFVLIKPSCLRLDLPRALFYPVRLYLIPEAYGMARPKHGTLCNYNNNSWQAPITMSLIISFSLNSYPSTLLGQNIFFQNRFLEIPPPTYFLQCEKSRFTSIKKAGQCVI